MLLERTPNPMVDGVECEATGMTADNEMTEYELGERVDWYYMIAHGERVMRSFSMGWFAPHGARHDINRLVVDEGESRG
jgi:hypothetical protein